MNRHHADQPIGWALVVTSALIVFGTLQGKHGVGPLFPQLMPIFGITFAVVALVALTAFCFWQRAFWNLALVGAVFVGGYLLGYVGESNAADRIHRPNEALVKVLNEHGVHRYNYNWTRHRFIVGIGLSSFVLGVKLLRENDSL